MDKPGQNYLYTSEVLLNLTHAQQEDMFRGTRFALIVQERSLTAHRPNSAWVGLSKLIKKGDALFLASLSALNLKLPTLLATLRKLVQRGVSIQIGNPGFLIAAGSSAPAYRLLMELDAQAVSHNKAVSKLHAAKNGGTGRPAKLFVEDLPEIRAMMADKHVTMADIIKRFSASRATIYNFLKQHENSKKT